MCLFAHKQFVLVMHCILIANTIPLLRDLYECITPDFATDWKVIGTLLGISREDLKIIEYDNPHEAVRCCNTMLAK